MVSPNSNVSVSHVRSIGARCGIIEDKRGEHGVMQRASTNLDGDQVAVPEAEVESLPQPEYIVLGNVFVRLEPCG